MGNSIIGKEKSNEENKTKLGKMKLGSSSTSSDGFVELQDDKTIRQMIFREQMNLEEEQYYWMCPVCKKYNARFWISIWESSTCTFCDKFTNGTDAWNNE